MNDNVVYIICTSVGRAILKSHFAYHSTIPISRIYCLSKEKGIKKSNYDDYVDLKSKYNIPIKYVNSINSIDVINELNEIKPTIIIQSGWSQKFSNQLLEIPKFGCIGQHPSPIPKGRGAACVNWAIIKGEREWGDSFFLMNDEYDAGMVVAQKMIDILDEDNVYAIYNKISWTSYSMIRDHLSSWIKGDFKEIKNKKVKSSYFKPREPKDGEISHNLKAIEQYNYVRALTKPYPGAFFVFNKKKIIVWEANLISSKNLKENLTKYSEYIFISENLFYLKGSCGNYIIPMILESDNFPIINNKVFLKNFLKN